MSDLPLYKEIIIWSILGSTLACFLLPLCGMLRQKLIPAIPPVPQFPGSSFPHRYAFSQTNQRLVLRERSVLRYMRLKRHSTFPDPKKEIGNYKFRTLNSRSVSLRASFLAIVSRLS